MNEYAHKINAQTISFIHPLKQIKTNADSHRKCHFGSCKLKSVNEQSLEKMFIYLNGA